MARKSRFGFKNLEVYQAAVDHYRWARATVARMKGVPLKVTSQILGAPLSTISNIAEANGREKMPGETVQHYRYALGSTFESASHLDVLADMGVIDDAEYNDRERHLDRLAALIGGMIRRHEKRRA